MALVIDDTLISNVADNLQAAMTTDPKIFNPLTFAIQPVESDNSTY